ncbi:tyrosine-type recombinase/integrase [Desulfosarcina ovata]|uniref:tyrosine-type recombinase/integrase n=1 Tax=Desulfosarcina ovata TaxID=83564 RepID=UPI0012D34670|nr:tyrosine-type recombinase/integrase [Desulfosarcina ovata]
MNLSQVTFLYLSHKRALGRKFRAEEDILRAFCKAIGDRPITAIEREVVLTFINGKGPITEYWTKKYRVLSGLYRYAIARGLAKASPLPRTIPKPTVPVFVPYIYSHEELKRLLDTVSTACAGRASIEEDVFRNLLLLLYGAGLRLSEALALTLGAVDLTQAYLHVHETKFFKSRLVPLGKDLTTILSDYISNRHKRTTQLESPLFCFRDGSPLSQSAVRSTFRRLRSYAGVLRDGGSRHQPRLHDLRHTSAVHRVIAWYRNGADLQELLPKLATYMGHVDLSATQRYLTMTPELLRLASLRFENYAIGDQS